MEASGGVWLEDGAGSWIFGDSPIPGRISFDERLRDGAQPVGREDIRGALMHVAHASQAARYERKQLLVFGEPVGEQVRLVGALGQDRRLDARGHIPGDVGRCAGILAVLHHRAAP